LRSRSRRSSPWDRYTSFCDLGCAQGALPVHVGAAHPHLHGIGFDLPPVGPIFAEFIAGFGLQDWLQIHRC
jgi:hypothetical protein